MALGACSFCEYSILEINFFNKELFLTRLSSLINVHINYRLARALQMKTKMKRK